MIFLWSILNVPLVVGYLVSLSKLRDEFCPPKAPEKYLATPTRPWTGETWRPSNRKFLIADGAAMAPDLREPSSPFYCICSDMGLLIPDFI